MSTFEATLEQLPRPILDKLRSIITRVRRLLLIRGIFATLAVALLCLLAIMAVDASVTIFSTQVRWGLSLTGLGITLVAAWWFLLRPLSRRFSLTQVARILEIRHPELQERISTAVELLSSDDPESIKGSEELIQAVVDSAVVDVQNVDPKREFKGVSAGRFVKLASVCLIFLALVLLIFPNQGWKLLARAAAPFLNIGNAYADTMVVTPGNIRIARGEELTIEMTVAHDRLRRAELRRKIDEGSDSVERMTLMGKTEEGAQRFSITFPEVNDSFQYRIRAGAALSEYFTVEAVPPPIVEKMTIRYDFPSYTGLEPVETESTGGEIRAVSNTRVTVTSVVNKEVRQAKVILNDTGELGESTVDGNVVTSALTLNRGTNGTWRLDIEDMDDFSNPRSPFPIQSLPDKAPVVRITNPVVRELRLKPSELLPIEFEVNEDFGFSEVAILVTPNGEPNPRVIRQAKPSPAGAAGTWAGTAPLNLADLNLESHHQRLQVQIRALDNLPESLGGPGEGVSDTITIILDKNAKSLAEQTIDAQKKELTEAIRKAKSELEQAKNEIRNAERELARSDEISERAERDLEEFRKEAAKAAETLEETAEKLADSVFKPQAEALENVAEEEIADARDAADMIPMTDEKNERVAEAREAREKIEEALADLREVEESIREADDDLDAISELNNLANDQRQLAQDAQRQAQEAANQQAQSQNEQQQREMQANQERAMNEFQQRQERIQEELGEMLKDNAAALEEILEKQQDRAEELANRAGQLAENQEQVREMTKEAAENRDAPRQAALQEQIMNQLRRMQEEIATDTKQVQENLARTNPEGPAGAERPEEDPPGTNEDSPQGDNPPRGQEGDPQGQEMANQNPPTPPPSLNQAAAETRNAAEALREENLEGAAESAREAGEALAQAAREAADPQSAAGDTPADGQEPGSPAGEEMAEGQQPASQQEPGSETGEPGSAQAEPSGEQMAENSPPNGSQPAQPAGENGNPEPAASPAMQEAAETLGELAERQQAIAEQLAAVEAGDLQEALALMEEQLSGESTQLREEATALAEALDSLGMRQSRYEAGQASNFLNNAAGQTREASQELSRAQQAQNQAESQGAVAEGELSPQAQNAMNQGASDQQQAERSLSKAAESLAKSAQDIGQTLEGLQPSEADERLADSSQMAESFNDISESAQSRNADQAAQRSQQAAQSLQQLAQQAMQQLGNMGQNPPGQQPSDSPQPSPDGQMAQEGGNQPNEGGKMADTTSDAIPPELLDMGITAKDWARFKGALTGGSATAIDTNLPAEYRELVGRYFQVIAKEADQKK